MSTTTICTNRTTDGLTDSVAASETSSLST